MSNENKTLYALMTLDLRDAEDYRNGFYEFLKKECWEKRNEANTAWTNIVTIPNDIGDVVAKKISRDFTSTFLYFLKNDWKEEYGHIPKSMYVSGIMQIGDEGYFSIEFIMNRIENYASVTIKYLN